MKMDFDVTRNKVLETLNNIGIPLSLGKEEDVDLRNIFTDSLMYISAIVQIENDLDIEIPDELLNLENLSSFNAFVTSLGELMCA